jgi:hypothetical protein
MKSRVFGGLVAALLSVSVFAASTSHASAEAPPDVAGRA